MWAVVWAVVWSLVLMVMWAVSVGYCVALWYEHRIGYDVRCGVCAIAWAVVWVITWAVM